MRFLLTLLIAAFVLLVALFAPYITVFVLALVFGVIFMPIQRFLARHMHRSVASLITTLIVVIVIIGPVAFIATRVVHEALDIVSRLQLQGTTTTALSAWIAAKVHAVAPHAVVDITNSIQKVLSFFAGKLGTIFSSALSVGANLLLSILALYYWFKDSDKLKHAVIEASPLSDDDDRTIMNALSASIHGVIRGSLLVALIQGSVASVGFLIFGVPEALFWGAVTALCALVPTLGTSLVMVPMIIYLFITGDTASAIGMLVWALGAVGLIDNLVGPFLMSRGGQVHPFFILMSVLGGVVLFGPVGLFAGPLATALFFAVFSAYTSHMKANKEHSDESLPKPRIRRLTVKTHKTKAV
jgi:predicted PurR-regulated permease PerM